MHQGRFISDTGERLTILNPTEVQTREPTKKTASLSGCILFDSDRTESQN